MIAVFYDRKHRCEVTSEQLMPTHNRVVRDMVSCDPDDMVKTGRRICPDTLESMDQATFDRCLAEGYFEGEAPKWEAWEEEMTPAVLYPVPTPMGDLCYKSLECPAQNNWDRIVFYHDLVFLRLE